MSLSSYSVRGELVEPLANLETSAQSPFIIAAFLARLQPLICRSEIMASALVTNDCEKTSFIGKRDEV